VNGIDYLLDTNFILGLLKREERVLETARRLAIKSQACAFSAVSRMELLGFPGITRDEEQLITTRLAMFRYVPISREIEDLAILVRRTRQVRLPDAVIAATGLFLGAKLLTLDQRLLSVTDGFSFMPADIPKP
jgi:predicted nucleic acid-binding protein